MNENPPEEETCFLASDKGVRIGVIVKTFNGNLLEDLRMDEDNVRNLNIEQMKTWLGDAPQKDSL